MERAEKDMRLAGQEKMNLRRVCVLCWNWRCCSIENREPLKDYKLRDELCILEKPLWQQFGSC